MAYFWDGLNNPYLAHGEIFGQTATKHFLEFLDPERVSEPEPVLSLIVWTPDREGGVLEALGWTGPLLDARINEAARRILRYTYPECASNCADRPHADPCRFCRTVQILRELVG